MATMAAQYSSSADAGSDRNKVEDCFVRMQSNLTRYARSNDRRMVLRSLREARYLNCMPMDEMQISEDVSLIDMEEELRKEYIVLNGISFRGSQTFLFTLRELCDKFCEPVSNLSSDDLYIMLLIRLARSNQSADCYVKMNNLMGSPDLMLWPTTEENHVPVQLDLYVANGCVQGTVRATNGYGLFRKADVKPHDLQRGTSSGRPWISLSATADERINFSTKASVRSLCVKLPKSLY